MRERLHVLNGVIDTEETRQMAKSAELDVIMKEIELALTVAGAGEDDQKGFVVAKNGTLGLTTGGRSKWGGFYDAYLGITARRLARALYFDELGELGLSALKLRCAEDGVLVRVTKMRCGVRYHIMLTPPQSEA